MVSQPATQPQLWRVSFIKDGTRYYTFVPVIPPSDPIETIRAQWAKDKAPALSIVSLEYIGTINLAPPLTGSPK